MNLDLPITSFAGATRSFQDTMKGVVPAGVIVRYDHPKAPPYWLLCDGAEYNRADYPELSKLFTGTSPTTFTVPDDSGYIIKV